MKKALAQNPNLLRTLIGLSITLIVLLSYAVYGATISPDYYIYETEATDNSFEDVELTKVFQNNETTWFGTISPDGQNLTWINGEKPRKPFILKSYMRLTRKNSKIGKQKLPLHAKLANLHLEADPGLQEIK